MTDNDPPKVLVLTDLHMVAPGERIIGLDPHARLTACLDRALADHPDADCVVLMGDLTHHGTPVEYERLSEVLARIPMPVLAMIGNHDRREVFRQHFPDTQVTADGFVQSIRDLPEHRLITLDTVDGPHTYAGMVCAARMAWLTEALSGSEGRKPVVFAHHPPMELGIPGMDVIRLLDGDPLLDLLAAHGAHLVGGHVHRTVSGSIRGVPFTILKSPCHQGPLDLAVPDASLSVDEPGAFGVLLMMPKGVVAHSEDVVLPRICGMIPIPPDAFFPCGGAAPFISRPGEMDAGVAQG